MAVTPHGAAIEVTPGVASGMGRVRAADRDRARRGNLCQLHWTESGQEGTLDDVSYIVDNRQSPLKWLRRLQRKGISVAETQSTRAECRSKYPIDRYSSFATNSLACKCSI